MSDHIPASTSIIQPFLEGLVRFLLPYFLPTSPDPDSARTQVLETLASYGGRSRSEILNAARIIAYSYAALEALTDAKAEGLSPSMRLRHRSNANALNRSCLQNEKILEKRLAAALPGAEAAEAATREDRSEADFQAALEPVQSNIVAYREPLPPNPPALPSSPGNGHSHHWNQVAKEMYVELGLSAKDIKALEKAAQLCTSSHDPRG